MKKLIAKISALALLAALVVVPTANAAGVSISIASADRQNFTIDLPAGVDLEAGDIITLVVTTTADGSPVDLSGNAVTAATLGAGAAETVTNAGDANGNIIITEGGDDEAAGADLTFAFTSALPTDAAYTISYSDTDDNFGAAMINFGTANQVTVSASVQPILTMALTNTTIVLGNLDVGNVVSSSTDSVVAVATNANGGWVASVADDAAAGLDSASAGATIAATATTVAGTEGFDIQVSETADPQTNGSVSTNFDNDDGDDVALTTSAQAIAGGTGPTAGYQATVDYRAGISAITPAAADYTTTLTYTVTATF